MTKEQLDPTEQRLVRLIEALPFGTIERLSIRDGSAVFDVGPRIIQTIKLDSRPERHPEPKSSDLTLRKEFEQLFEELSLLYDAVVSIECRHGLPFRLSVERRPADLTGVDRV